MELTAENMLYGPNYYCDSETSEIVEGFGRYDRQKVFTLARKFFLINDIVPNYPNMFRFEQALRCEVPLDRVTDCQIIDFIAERW